MQTVEVKCVEPDCIESFTVEVRDEGMGQEPQECTNCGREYYPGWRMGEPEVYVDEGKEQPWKFERLRNHEDTVEHFEEEEYDPEKHGSPE